MKEKKGKIFNQQEVEAIIAGGKTMFREVIKPLKHESLVNCVLKGQLLAEDSKKVKGFQVYFQKPKNKWFAEDKPTGIIVKSKFEVGQEIFVKESWQAFTGETLGTPLGKMRIYSYPAKDGDIITYKADADLTKDFTTYRSSTTMPQWASRITLKIKSVKVESLQDISEEDAIKEGVSKLFTEEEMKHVSKVHPTEKNDTYKNYLWHGHIGRTITSKQSYEWEYQFSSYKKAKDSFASLWNSTHKKQEHKWEANPWVFAYEFEIINNLTKK